MKKTIIITGVSIILVLIIGLGIKFFIDLKNDEYSYKKITQQKEGNNEKEKVVADKTTQISGQLNLVYYVTDTKKVNEVKVYTSDLRNPSKYVANLSIPYTPNQKLFKSASENNLSVVSKNGYVFAVDGNTQKDIVRLDLKSGTKETVYSGDNTIYSIMVSDDGQILVIVEVGQYPNTNIYSYDIHSKFRKEIPLSGSAEYGILGVNTNLFCPNTHKFAITFDERNKKSVTKDVVRFFEDGKELERESFVLSTYYVEGDYSGAHFYENIIGGRPNDRVSPDCNYYIEYKQRTAKESPTYTLVNKNTQEQKVIHTVKDKYLSSIGDFHFSNNGSKILARGFGGKEDNPLFFKDKLSSYLLIYSTQNLSDVKVLEDPEGDLAIFTVLLSDNNNLISAKGRKDDISHDLIQENLQKNELRIIESPEFEKSTGDMTYCFVLLSGGEEATEAEYEQCNKTFLEHESKLIVIEEKLQQCQSNNPTNYETACKKEIKEYSDFQQGLIGQQEQWMYIGETNL